MGFWNSLSLHSSLVAARRARSPHPPPSPYHSGPAEKPHLTSVHRPVLTRSLPPAPMALMDFDPRLQCCVWNRARLSQGVPSCAE